MSDNTANGNEKLMLDYCLASGLYDRGFMSANPHAKVLYFQMIKERTAIEDQLLVIARKELEAFNLECIKDMEELISALSGGAK